MYLSTPSESKCETTKTTATSSVEYHTSIIQSIEIVKRPLLFNQHDNDTSSRFFSSSVKTKTSIFDAINENEKLTSHQEKISPVKSNKRFKGSNTIKDEESLSQTSIQSSMAL